MDTEVIYGNPGTGKTYNLVKQIESLHKDGYKREDIQVLSHTRVAAKEIADRAKGAKANTLHSLAYKYGGIIKEQVASTSEIKKFSGQIGIPLKGVGDDGTTSIEAGDEYINIITLASNKMVDPLKYYKKELSTAGHFSEFKYFYESYLNWKRTYGMVDFNDMISIACDGYIDPDFRVLFIDEAQDLSPLQWLFIDKMIDSKKIEKVVITGDPDQALFIWGGADSKGMERFAGRYYSKVMELTQSYRVPKLAHHLGSSIISKVKNRYIKDYTPTDIEGDVLFYNSPFVMDWKRYVNHDTLILYRTHSLRREAEEELMRAHLPYTVLNGRPGWCDNSIADALRIIDRMRNNKNLMVSPKMISILNRVASIPGKTLLAYKNFDTFFKHDPGHTLNIPMESNYYYRDVDLSSKPNIKLSTIHGAKGMEAEVVIVLDGMVQRVAEGLETNPDQEHRVWFVAVTRTIKKLIWVNSIQVEGYPI